MFLVLRKVRHNAVSRSCKCSYGQRVTVRKQKANSYIELPDCSIVLRARDIHGAQQYIRQT